MTREEAVKMLEYIKHIGNGESEYKNDAQAIALDMAIEALEQQPCDAISRQAVNDLVDELARAISDERSYISRGRSTGRIMQDILDLPSVTPNKKTGHWIVDWSATSRLNRDRSLTYQYHVHCDRCGYRWDYTTDKKGSLVSNFCPNCGVKMVELQKSEDKE